MSLSCRFVGTVTVHWENIHICEIEAAVIYNVENTMNMYLIRIQHKLLSELVRVSRNQVVDHHSSCTLVPYLSAPKSVTVPCISTFELFVHMDACLSSVLIKGCDGR